MVMVNGKSLPKDEWFRRYYWDLRKNAWCCSRCSNCKWVDSWEVKSARFARVCPSSHYYMFDAYSCQGRMDVSLAIIEGRLKYEDSPALLDILSRCNFCGACDAMCKRVQDMEPLRVIQEMRFRLVGDGQIPSQYQPVIEHLRNEDSMVTGAKKDRGRWAYGLGAKDLATQKAEVVFHAGCRFSFDEELWPVARTSLSLLQQAGVDVGIMGREETCCGGRAYEMGFKGEFTKYAEHNIQAWRNAGVRTVVTGCADGYYAFKHLYPELGISFEVCHMVEYVERLIETGRLTFRRPVPIRVTYHDPCHLGRRAQPYVPGQAVTGHYDVPRKLLGAIPGVELVEMERIKEFAWCCGAGGGAREAYPDFNTFTANERVEEAAATGASALVTACPWCQRNFRDVLSGRKIAMEIVDLISLVSEAV